MRDASAGARPAPIPQAEVERLLVLRQDAQEASAAAAKREAELTAEEERLKAALKAGAPIERGRYFLTLDTEQTGRSVAWRKVVEKELGKAFAEKVLADTPNGEREVLRVLQEVSGDGAGRGTGKGE